MKILEPTLGTDFELAILDENTNDFKSVVGRLGGTKDEPLSIGEGCFRQEDNVAAEFNIPPVDNLTDWLQHIVYCIETGTDLIKENFDEYHTLIPVSSANYLPIELQTDAAKLFGCEPSYSAYMDSMNQPVDATKAESLRSFGFHIHVGFRSVEGAEFSEFQRFMRYMDVYLGLPSILIDRDTQRSKVGYGKPGDFRYKVIEDNEGELIILEYRTLSSALLASPRLISWAYDNTLLAIEAFNENRYGDLKGRAKVEIFKAIKKRSEEDAALYVAEYCVPFPNMEIDRDGSIVTEDQLLNQAK